MISFRRIILPITSSIKWFNHNTTQNCKKQFSDNSKKDETESNRNKTKNTTSSVPAYRNPFETLPNKNKETYMDMLEIFENRDIRRRNHVEFIYAALKSMAEFNVEYDLEVYKALINIMPKGKFIPTNLFQAEFQHYPKQQQCIIDLLEQMEDLGVIPDYEMEAQLLNIFGRRGHPLRKYWRMMYWMPKFKNLSPWPLPNPVPDESLELAKLALERMCSVDLRSKITIFQTKDITDALDDTWIVSGISEEQSDLLNKHPKEQALYIEGPFLIWLRNRSIHYFTLRGDPDIEFLKNFKNKNDVDDVTKIEIPIFGRPITESGIAKCRSVHQQDDGTIFAICATGTSTKDSLLSWIRFLEMNGNPSLGEIPILFRFKSILEKSVIPVESNTNNTSNSAIMESGINKDTNEKNR